MKNLRRAFIFVALLLLSVLAVAFNAPVRFASGQKRLLRRGIGKELRNFFWSAEESWKPFFQRSI
jgi:hypothetical protein